MYCVILNYIFTSAPSFICIQSKASKNLNNTCTAFYKQNSGFLPAKLLQDFMIILSVYIQFNDKTEKRIFLNIKMCICCKKFYFFIFNVSTFQTISPIIFYITPSIIQFELDESTARKYIDENNEIGQDDEYNFCKRFFFLTFYFGNGFK